MCELFGASAATKRNFSRWLVPFRSRGGETADNPDGWGLAHWNDAHTSIEKSPEPGWQSARFLELAHNLNSKLVLAHVRKATHPLTPNLHNTHPFAHTCCDREWGFAHNGMVPKIANWPCDTSVCNPKGETDSETAFCHLLANIAGDYDAADHSHWLVQLSAVATAIAATGKFNFLLSDGRLLIAYDHDHLYYIDHDDGQERYALVSTEPLTNEDWRCFDAGELRVYRDGTLLASHVPGRISEDAENLIADLNGGFS